MKKRAAKRYDYRCMGHCMIEGERLEIQIFNISTSGIQFGSQIPIATDVTIQLIWNDDLLGNLDPTLVIAREVLGSEEGTPLHLYGAQYYNLNESIKYKLLLLLKDCKRQHDQRIQEQVKSDTKNSLSIAMSDGDSTLRAYFDGKPIPSVLKLAADGIKDYEKKSFKLVDLTSICIQKLTIHNFQCQVLIHMLSSTLEKPHFHVPFLKLVVEQMDKISVIETSVEEIGKETAVEARKLMNESSNRLFYTKQSLLQKTTDAFNTSEPKDGTYKSLLQRITEEYEKLLKVIEIAPTDNVQKFSSLTQKPRDFSLVDAITDIGSASNSKSHSSKSSTLPFTLGTLGLMMLMLFFRQCVDYFETRSVKSGMQIPLKISKYETYGNQIDIFVPAAQWTSMSANEQHNVTEKIRKYLVENDIYNCTMYGNDNEILQVVYKEP